MATLALVFSGLNETMAVAGEVNIYVADLSFFLLVLLSAFTGSLFSAPQPWERAVLWALGVFVLYIGASLVVVVIEDPAHFVPSLVSWFRLVQTLSLFWLVQVTLTTRRDFRLVIAAVVFAGLFAVASAASEATWGGLLQARYGGLLNVNSLGLVSSYLILAASFIIPSRVPSLRIGIFAAGLLGLLLAKSVGGLLAATAALGLGYLVQKTRGQTQRAPLAKPLLAVTGMSLFAFLTISFARPETLPTSTSFSTGSTSHRIVLASAGLELFFRHPLVGVGWQRSSSPEIIGQSEVSQSLHDRFESVPPQLFPNVSPSTVHNTYIQLAAELGLLGLAVMIYSAVRLKRRIHSALAILSGGPFYNYAVLSIAGLVVTLLWLNGNALYGGQPETYGIALFLGLLSAGVSADFRGRAGSSRSTH
ncbi:MAG: O-antigen ligase family protein [Actinomycetota bacterium]